MTNKSYNEHKHTVGIRWEKRLHVRGEQMGQENVCVVSKGETGVLKSRMREGKMEVSMLKIREREDRTSRVEHQRGGDRSAHIDSKREEGKRVRLR